MTTRRITDEEMIAKLAYEIKYNRPVRFRHFMVEATDWRSANGVRQKEHNRSKLRIINGVPHVMNHGKLEAITATWTDEVGGEKLDRPLIWDIRLASPYLDR